jgi:CDP-diacylglycerol--serine O-phosphatidyltransferase
VTPGEERRRRRIPPLRRGVYLLPNLFTTAGLFAGFFAVISTLRGDYWLAAITILVAQCCDALDGRVARLTRTGSSFGVQYDSLSDLVAFGVAPAILVYAWALGGLGRWGWLAATLYVTCGALRLARFNVQISSVERRHFVGLPIPAAAAVIATTVLLHYDFRGEAAPHRPWLMLGVMFLLAALMVSEVRYLSFKDVQLHRRHPFSVLLGLIIVGAVTVGAPWPMLFVMAVGYAASGPFALMVRLLGPPARPTGAREQPLRAVSPLDKVRDRR